ncbi:MAG TPA: hypothetical protein VGC84_14920 [Ilumatobacteraceae bacterium]
MPFIALWMLQWIGYVPGFGIVNVALPFPGTAVLNEPSSAVTVWEALSLFLIVNSVPAFTVVEPKLNPEIDMPGLAAAAVVPPAAPAVVPDAPVVAPVAAPVVAAGAAAVLLLDLLSLLQPAAVTASKQAPAIARRTRE